MISPGESAHVRKPFVVVAQQITAAPRRGYNLCLPDALYGAFFSGEKLT